MEEYDRYCPVRCPGKIPDWYSEDYRRRVGDCIYDFSRGMPPEVRPSVHTEQNREHDLSGRNVLISNHFYYFGDKPVKLLEVLKPIIHRAPGHKSVANERHIEGFTSWISGTSYVPNRLYGKPQLQPQLTDDPDCRHRCACGDLEE